MELPRLGLLEREQGGGEPVLREVPPRDTSLVNWAGTFFRPGPDDPPVQPRPEGQAAVCADGYVRRSPVQPYRVPPEYKKARRRKALLGVLVVLALLLLAAGVWRSGLLPF